MADGARGAATKRTTACNEASTQGWLTPWKYCRFQSSSCCASGGWVTSWRKASRRGWPADVLTIDGQFVRDIVTYPLDDAADRCFVQLAKVVKMATLAEFVDHPAVLAPLQERGVDYAQGFLLHRHEPVALLRLSPGFARMPAMMDVRPLSGM